MVFLIKDIVKDISVDKKVVFRNLIVSSGSTKSLSTVR